MKIKNIILYVLIAIASVTLFQIDKLNKENKKLEAENIRLVNNQDALLTEAESYRVADSLNATQVVALKLTIEEYKKYKANDAELISQLKSKLANAIISANTQSEIKLSALAYDSIRIDTIYKEPKSIRCFNYNSKWIDVEGCLTDDTVELQIANRDALKIVESVEYKRFLGFLWKTNKIKRQQVDVVSENPATSIISVDYVKVEP